MHGKAAINFNNRGERPEHGDGEEQGDDDGSD